MFRLPLRVAEACLLPLGRVFDPMPNWQNIAQLSPLHRVLARARLGCRCLLPADRNILPSSCGCKEQLGAPVINLTERLHAGGGGVELCNCLKL